MNICGAKYGKRPWPDSTCHLRPGHYGDHEAEAWDLGGTIRWDDADKELAAAEEGAVVQTFYVVKDEGDGGLAYWHFDTEAEARAHPYAQDEDAIVIAIPSAEEGAAGTVRGNSENLSVKPGGFFDKRLADHEAAEEEAAEEEPERCPSCGDAGWPSTSPCTACQERMAAEEGAME